MFIAACCLGFNISLVTPLSMATFPSTNVVYIWSSPLYAFTLNSVPNTSISCTWLATLNEAPLWLVLADTSK